MITVDSKAFLKALDLACTFTDKRHKIPTLAALKATANDSLALEGTDLDHFARAEIAYHGDHASFCLPEPRRLRHAVARAGGSAVHVEPEDEALRIHAGPLALDMATRIAADDHPGSELPATEEFAATLGDGFFSQVARILPAISTEETRYYLNGICCWHLGDWTWRFVASDGHRLHMVDVALPDATGTLPDRTIIPRRFITRAGTIFARTAEPVRLTYGRRTTSNEQGIELPVESPNARRVTLRSQIGPVSLKLATKLIDGTYPDVSRVIPVYPPHSATLSRADLVRAINAMSPIGEGMVRAFSLTFAPGDCQLSHRSAEVGTARMTIPARHNLEPGFTIGFNGRYLLDVLNHLRGDEVHMALTNPTAPTLITDPTDTAFRAVVVSMRV